jgi:PPM family protein phosphatase
LNPFDPEERPVHLTVAAFTDPGRRRTENQDSYLVADLSRSAAADGVLLSPAIGGGGPAQGGAFTVGPRGALLLVADGMGGVRGGALASRIAVLTVHEELMNGWISERRSTPRVFASRLVAAVEQANARIREEARRGAHLDGMGTTATAAGVLDGFLYLAQVGDSRAYLVRDGAAIQLTRDQSVVQTLLDAGEITEEEAARSEKRNLVLQALGAQAEIKVDLTYQELRRDDVMVLCSDGLSGLVTREEIAGVLSQGSDLAAAGGELIRFANERGGPDNITVLLARAGGAGLQEPREQDAVGRHVYSIPSA